MYIGDERKERPEKPTKANKRRPHHMHHIVLCFLFGVCLYRSNLYANVARHPFTRHPNPSSTRPLPAPLSHPSLQGQGLAMLLHAFENRDLRVLRQLLDHRQHLRMLLLLLVLVLLELLLVRRLCRCGRRLLLLLLAPLLLRLLELHDGRVDLRQRRD